MRSYRDLLPVPAPVIKVEPVASSTSLVILHLGSVCGLGHVSMKAAFASVLKDMPQATLSVIEMHSFTGGQQLAAVDTAASAVLGARCQVWSDLDAFSRVCQEQGPTWAQKGARVLILLNWDGLHTADAPADSLLSRTRGTGGQSVPGMHAIMDVLGRLGSLISAEHMGVPAFHCSEASDADVECLNKILGPSQTLSSELYAVPQSPWTVHANPSA